ncbi:MAG: hypothetical protein RRB22_04390 [Gammaproteobacteria bacterium]|nr:hypothetical protein [Gammaproteobacteria bacterium]
MDRLITTVVTSALVATVAGAAINAWLDNRKSKHATRFEALSAAVSLEGYALACSDKIADHDLALSSDGHAGAFLGSVPEFSELSVIAGFLRPKKASVANRLMIFPQDIRQAGQQIAFWWDVTADAEQTHAAAVIQVSQIGIMAMDLAKDMREAFELPSRELVFGAYNVRQTLTENIKEHSDV